MPKKNSTGTVKMPRILENSRLMFTHETVVDLFNGRATEKTLRDAFQFGLFGVDFASSFRQPCDYHLEDDLICAEDYSPERDPLPEHPRIRQLTAEEAEKHGQELVEDEEKLKDRAENRRLKKLRKKERKRLEKESATKDKDAPEEEEEEPEEFKSSGNQKENMAEGNGCAAFPNVHPTERLTLPLRHGVDKKEKKRKKKLQVQPEEERPQLPDGSEDMDPHAKYIMEEVLKVLQELKEVEMAKRKAAGHRGGNIVGASAETQENPILNEDGDGDGKEKRELDGKLQSPQEFISSVPKTNQLEQKSLSSVKQEMKQVRPAVQDRREANIIQESPQEFISSVPKTKQLEQKKGKQKSLSSVKPEMKQVTEDRPAVQDRREANIIQEEFISSVPKTKQLEQKKGKQKSLSSVKQEMKQVTEDRPAVQDRREANIIQEEFISSVPKTKQLEQKKGKQKSLSSVKQEMKQVTEDRPAVQDRREANIIQEEFISSVPKTKQLEQKKGKQKSLSSVKQEMKQVTEDRPAVQDRREANIIQEEFISSVPKTKQLEQKKGKQKSLSSVKQEMKQVTEDRPAVQDRREANIIQEEFISSVPKTKQLEQKKGKQKSLSSVKQEMKQVTEDRPAVQDRREANIIQEEFISSVPKTKQLEQKKGKQKSLSSVKQEIKQVTEDRPAVQDRREANIIQEKKEVVEDLVKSAELANIGNRFAACGQLEEAVKYFTGAIQYNPKEFKLFGNRSFCYERMQDYERALSDADVALCMSPNWTKGLFRKGKALFGLKRYYDASLIYEEMVKQDSTCTEAAQELKRVQAVRLMEMGFTWEQSLNALTNHTFEEALETLFGSEDRHASNNNTTQPTEKAGEDDGPGVQCRRVPGAAQSPCVDPTRPNSQSPCVDPTRPKSQSPSVDPTRPKSQSPCVDPTRPNSQSPCVDPTRPKSQSPCVDPTRPKSQSPCVDPTRPKSQSPSVDPTRPRSQSPPRLPRTGHRPELFPVWVGSVMSTITEAGLKSLFSRVGFVYSIKMLSDQECAFVHYTKREDSEKAIRLLNGVAYEGVILSVRYPINFRPEIGMSHSAVTEPIVRPPTSPAVGRTGQIQW